jgi:hypothetical protein
MIDWAAASPAIGGIGVIIALLIFMRRIKAEQRRREAAARDRRGG